MTKPFALLIYIILWSQLLLAKPLQWTSVDLQQLSNPAAKINTAGFRYMEEDYLIIQPSQNEWNKVQSEEVQVLSYLGDGIYWVKTKSANTTRLKQLSPIVTGYLQSESKISEECLQLSGTVPVTILYANTISFQQLNSLLAASGISTTLQNTGYPGQCSAELNAKQIRAIAELPVILHIEKSYPQKNKLLYEAGTILGVSQVQENLPYGYNLKGQGMRVGIWDDGPVGVHIDLPNQRNIVVDKERSNPVYLAHSTEVGSCIGGSGNIYALQKGIAPLASMYYWDYLNNIVKEVEEAKKMYDISISNHSYNFAATNCFQSGLYIADAANLDAVVAENPTLLPIVAVGNSASICASTDTFRSVDIGFQGCKNAITVGWLFGNEKIVGNSGRGPTEDGRLKPELVAKGFGVGVAAPNNSLVTVYGSSYAAPQVAGLAALMQQQYKKQFGTTPNGALMKAILCNTARDMGNPGPDYTFGFGKPDAYKAIYSVEQSLFVEGNVEPGAFQSYGITVPQGTAKLSVTLNWTDKAGNPIAEKTIVQNLDLKVVTPAGDTVLPWKLNPESFKNNAFRGIDNINTIEQVTINNPVAGSYQLVVKGTQLPFGQQAYAVAYLAQPRKIELAYPNGSEVLDAGAVLDIRWFTNGIDSLGRIDFSDNNGVTWQTLVNNIQLRTQKYTTSVPAVSSNQCLVRIVYGGNQTVSASAFTIGNQIFYPNILHAVCDKSVRITWPSVSGASGYKVYLFADTAWVNVGQTTGTAYTISNLKNGQQYFYALSTIKNGVEGNRSLANGFIPTPTAACASVNDVGVYTLLSPKGGRKLTSSALTANERLSFIIKNYGTATQTAVGVSYTINNGPVRSATLTETMTGSDTAILQFAIPENLSAEGNYTVKAWSQLVADENRGNDTLVYVIRHLPNPVVTLPFNESFEQVNEHLTEAVFGMNGISYADFYPEPGGRLRTTEGNLFARSGSNALTLDNYLNSAQRKNEVIFTLNLSSYVDSVVMLSLNFLNRAETDSLDYIYARGNDAQPWVLVYNLYTNRQTPSIYKNTGGINLYKLLKLNNGQDFSASTQIKIVQTGNKPANNMYGNGGYTFDDLSLYVAGNDVGIADVQVKKVHCINNYIPQRIKIKVQNNAPVALNNIPVFYQVNNNPPVSEIISASIASDAQLEYIFNQALQLTSPGLYTIKVWVQNAGDKYRLNDSINTASIIILPSTNTFPYYNDFESNDAQLISEGISNSWIWTQPSKYYIDNAAQDNRAWTTGGSKGYNFNEYSHLYLGCLDVSSLTKDPLIAFNMVSIMQTQSDSAFAEYSTDGISWKRLGCYNCGLNWYNGFQGKPYWDKTIYPWQTVHTTLPLSELADKTNFMYRITLQTDDFAAADGIGIDDLHILPDYEEMSGTDSSYVTQVSDGNGWISFYRNGRLIASLHDDGNALGNVVLGVESDESKRKFFANKNILPRNWVIKPQNAMAGNYTLRLYLLNSEYTGFVLEEDSINRMGDIGLLRYLGLNTNLDISDNHVRSSYKWFTPQDIQFYPYQNGYYVEFKTDTLGEFYLISTRTDKDAIQSVNMVDFSAKIINDDVLLEWQTSTEINSRDFIIQYAFDAATFIDIDTVPAGGNSVSFTPYDYLHVLNATQGVFYYRIKIIDNSNKVSYSLIDSVSFAPLVGIRQETLTMKAYAGMDDIYLQLDNLLPQQGKVLVYDVKGQLMFSRSLSLQRGEQPLKIPAFAGWGKGAYFLQLQTADKYYYSKLIKY